MNISAWVRTAGHRLLYLPEEVAWQQAVVLGCCRAGKVTDICSGLEKCGHGRYLGLAGTCRGALVGPTLVDVT